MKNIKSKKKLNKKKSALGALKGIGPFTKEDKKWIEGGHEERFYHFKTKKSADRR